ncbi:MAG TPA: TIR domain-containing protein [Longimicrobium sp.]|nr:TIR domain-containing protein [Longimicrobium sp.]
MADIFICYRRQDSEGQAGRLHDLLMDRFGKRAVFIDVEDLYPGVDFDQVIQSTLLRSRVVLVVIGPRWVDSRLKDEDDFVRREILAALKARKRLIPVLVGGARMPRVDKLPPELAALAGKNAVTLSHATWRTDVNRLITSLERYLARAKTAAGKPGAAKPRSKPAPRKKGASEGTVGSPPAKKAGSPPAKKAGPPPAKKPAAKRPKPASGSPGPESVATKDSARTRKDPPPRASRPRKPAPEKGAGGPAAAKRSGPRKSAAKTTGQPTTPRRSGRRPAGKNTPRGKGRRPG